MFFFGGVSSWCLLNPNFNLIPIQTDLQVSATNPSLGLSGCNLQEVAVSRLTLKAG